MADGLREVLAKYGLNDEAMAEIESAATPETFRTQLAELGAKAKRTDELESELASIRSEPKRIEAYKRVGLLPPDATDASGLKPYQKDWLSQNVPADKLEDLEFVANKVNEGGFEANFQSEQTQGQSEAERITAATVDLGTGAPVRTSKDAKQQAFLDELDSIPDGDKAAMAEVLAKHGMSPQSEG